MLSKLYAVESYRNEFTQLFGSVVTMFYCDSTLYQPLRLLRDKALFN